MLVRRDAKSRNRANTAEAKAKALIDQVSSLEAQVKELETKLESSWDSVTELKERVRDHKVEIAEKVKYVALLEECLMESKAITLCQEGQLHTL